MEQVVCGAEELAPGAMVTAKLGPVPVCVGRTGSGALFGVVDKCLHQGGQLSRGALQGTTDGKDVGQYEWVRQGEILKCPWHGYEYDVLSGGTLFDRCRKLRTFRVWEKDGEIVAEL